MSAAKSSRLSGKGGTAEMSRIGRKPIAVPAGVDGKIDGHTVTVKGPKGTLTQTFRPEIGIAPQYASA